ncbi:MAG: GNAT family N-acetyltransferase [Prevotella sp.]|nr:GNAT family N-acetyltransferase [Prevotella sp.]
MRTVTLRAIEPEDLEVLYQIENDSQEWALGCSNVPYSRYVLHEYIANQSCDIYADKQVRLMVVNEDKVPVGIVDLVNFDPKNRRAELGMIIMRQYRHQGYGKLALNEICRYALTTLHLKQIYLYVDTNNMECVNLFENHCNLMPVRLKDWLYDGREYQDALLFQIIL